jgi:hypothetical protein
MKIRAVLASLLLIVGVVTGAWIHGPGTLSTNCSVSGGIYTGFTQSYCDDFNAPDFVGPTNPNGKYFTTRAYADTLRNTSGTGVDNIGYQTDPLHTGFNDFNRGVPVGYNNLSVSGGVMGLQTRAATTAEKTTFAAPAQVNVNSMVFSDGAIGWYVGSACNILVEANIKVFINSPLNGWITAFWENSGAPIYYFNANEFDMFESEGDIGGPAGTANWNYNEWAGRTATFRTTVATWGTYDQTAFHTFTIKLSSTTNQMWKDGVSLGTYNRDANSVGQIQYFIFDSRQTTTAGVHNQTDWDASGTSPTSGAKVSVDYARVWRTTGCPHYAPINLPSDLLISYAGSSSVVLPSATALWGDATVTEYVQCRPSEQNDPGMTASTSFSQFPSGVTYNSGTRTIAADFSFGTGNAGVLHCMVAAYKPTGATFQPARFNIYRGPNITTASTINGSNGVPFTHDFYPECDVGAATINPNNGPPYKIAITGLPAPLTLNSNGIVTGTPSGAGDSTLSLTCRNSGGQTANKTVTLHIT